MSLLFPKKNICADLCARAKATDTRRIKRYLVVMDEARRLRSFFKTGNIIAKFLKKCADHAPRLLHTAWLYFLTKCSEQLFYQS
jgi:hypothetical protein